MDLAIMIEGQNGLTWGRWQRLARLVEDLGFAGLYRSDHFTNSRPPEIESLECWTSLTWLASHTQRLEFGPLVSPVSFRDPILTARMACHVDDLSGGRLTLGLGAGWQEREHAMFGYDLLDLPARFARYAEALEVVARLLGSGQPASFEGRYYRLREAVFLPRPSRPGGPPILVGGDSRKYVLPLAAQYAREWNCTYKTPDQLSSLNARLDELLAERGREPQDVRRSMMTGLAFGRDAAEAQAKAARWSGPPAELRQRGIVAGTAAEVVEQLGKLAETGIHRVMLQWFDLDDLDRLEAFGRSVVPQVH
jgi:F420-dependent oxidoreductase-like protein